MGNLIVAMVCIWTLLLFGWIIFLDSKRWGNVFIDGPNNYLMTEVRAKFTAMIIAILITSGILIYNIVLVFGYRNVSFHEKIYCVRITPYKDDIQGWGSKVTFWDDSGTPYIIRNTSVESDWSFAVSQHDAQMARKSSEKYRDALTPYLNSNR